MLVFRRNLVAIKVIALDAMQEFGQSVLDELVNMMQERLDMFTEEAKNGYPVKDIASYRKYTGKKMPRATECCPVSKKRLYRSW